MRRVLRVAPRLQICLFCTDHGCLCALRALYSCAQTIFDDGFIVWRGTAAAARTMFAELNALDSNIKLTFEISNYKAIFLDLTMRL
jgi:hypothetical protein